MAEAPGRTAAVGGDAAHQTSRSLVGRSARRPRAALGTSALVAVMFSFGALPLGGTAWAVGAAHAASATSARAPAWAQLPQAQKAFLAPIEESWDSLSVQTRRKLIGIAQRQATMTSEQRERVQSRLSQWAQLSTEERDLARRNYQQLNRLPPDQRQDLARRWQEAKQPAPAGTAEVGGEGATPAPQQ